MSRKSTVILSMLACASVAMQALAQGPVADDLLQRFDARFVELDSLIFKEAAESHALGLTPSSSDFVTDSAYALAVDALVGEQVRSIHAETGIQITGQTYYRADGAFGFDEDDEAVSRYTGKIQAEVRWYFLQSGLLKRKGREEAYRLQGQISVLEHQKERVSLTVYQQKELLRQISDSLLAGALAHRVQNLTLLQEANLYLLSNANIPSDELLNVLTGKAEAERQLATLVGAFPAATDLSNIDAYIINVDTAAMLSHIFDTQIDMRLLDLRGQLLDQQASNTTWWSDVRIAPFVRYSHYFRHNVPSSSNVDAGVSFTIPVNTEARRKRSVISAQKNLMETDLDDLHSRTIDRVSYITQEIERMNRAINGEWERLQYLKQYLRMRNTAYANVQGEFSRLARLKEYNNYIQSIEKIIEFQYRRDCLVADLQAFLADESVLDFCNIKYLGDINLLK